MQELASGSLGDPKPKLSWGTGNGKRYLVPAVDIVAFDVLINRFDRSLIDTAR